MHPITQGIIHRDIKPGNNPALPWASMAHRPAVLRNRESSTSPERGWLIGSLPANPASQGSP
jgi:hypothetical protein